MQNDWDFVGIILL